MVQYFLKYFEIFFLIFFYLRYFNKNMKCQNPEAKNVPYSVFYFIYMA